MYFEVLFFVGHSLPHCVEFRGDLKQRGAHRNWHIDLNQNLLDPGAQTYRAQIWCNVAVSSELIFLLLPSSLLLKFYVLMDG